MIAFVLGACLTPNPYLLQSTTFSAFEGPNNPNPRLGCIGRVLRDDTDMAVASRDLECFTRVQICVPTIRKRKRRCVTATVLDRLGHRRRTDGHGYRSYLDLAPAVKAALRHSGYERISMWTVP